MKRILLLTALIISIHLSGQDFKIGIHFDPLISWFSPNTKLIDKDGSKLGFSGGLMIETAFNGVFKDAEAFNKQMNLLFISTGTEERSPKESVEALKAHGIKNIVFHESQGTAHEWLTWRRALNEFAPRLFK